MTSLLCLTKSHRGLAGTLDLVPAQRVMLRKTVRTLALCSEVSGEAAMSATQGKAARVWAVGKRKSRRTLAG